MQAGKGARRQSLADQRAVRAVEMRTTQGSTWAKIGSELGVTPQAAQGAYRRGVLLLVPADDIAEYRALALQKLDYWEEKMLFILEGVYEMVNFGKKIDGVVDVAPNMQAMDRLVKIERERRAIVGYSAPSKRVLEVVSEDAFERAIRELNEDSARLEREALLKDALAEASGVPTDS